MSTTYHAAAVVGCRIPKSKIFLTEKVRECEHNIPESRIKDDEFCAKCGKPLWVTLHKTIPEYNRDMNTLCTFRVFDIEWEDFITVAGPGAVSEVANDCEKPSQLIHLPASDVRKRMERGLEKIGLWDDNEFGIWAILWGS
ncbi:hypothetical protein LCGC14_0143160 [marine sediment metagenome]|uniref:Uncharacterized protein n=1 Tax=marine sediment metagenome TaxID=412755 RepID=A0A0F9V4Z1_9ZZZZ